MKNREKSKLIYQNLCKRIPGGVNSPARAFINLDLIPLITASAKNDIIEDVDQNKYIDFCMSWGSLILGHSPKKIMDKVIEQLSCGTSYGTSTPIEEKIASLIIEKMPSIEKIRFVSSGTEAVMSAVRVARGYTQKNLIIKFNGNYHGHHDSFLVKAGSALSQLNSESSSDGVPKELVQNMVSLEYNDFEKTKNFLEDLTIQKKLAAVIIEPIAGNIGVVPAEKKFLEMLREKTKQANALLIFDEVITGFRVGINGAQGLYGIDPDLTCLGKIIGGGFPAAAFGGKRVIMDKLAPLGSVFQAGTLSGNPIAMLAGYLTLVELCQNDFYEKLEQQSSILLDPIEQFIQENDLNVSCQKVGSMFSLFFGVKNVSTKKDLDQIDTSLFKSFFHYLFDHGVFIPPSPYESWFISTAHEKKNLIKTKDLIISFLGKLCKERATASVMKI